MRITGRTFSTASRLPANLQQENDKTMLPHFRGIWARDSTLPAEQGVSRDVAARRTGPETRDGNVLMQEGYGSQWLNCMKF